MVSRDRIPIQLTGKSCLIYKINVNNEQSKIAQHAHGHDHFVDFNNAKIVTTELAYYKNLFLEAWFSVGDKKKTRETSIFNSGAHVPLPLF